ncbi:hypothetical protein [Rhodococcus sp. 11-3]|uniref:hypothetical protein n=1 Tax=Rhodococcus sp. 11-3 TaxID=2854796 RepID=UPI00203FAC75|nr:hypothetical protein [Rhodococcus sp. 11-3]USC16248.1 hypothetical protein KZJ41_04830 [Rhodococcus sp. 11-3]
MRLRVLAIAPALVLLVACGDESDDSTIGATTTVSSALASTTTRAAAQTTTTTAATQLAPAPGKVQHSGNASECAVTPMAYPGLTEVDVQDGATGHPSGAKTITWHWDGDISTGTVAFTATMSGPNGQPITRGVKLIDGEVIANYVFSGARQENISIPPRWNDASISVALPAASGTILGSSFNWSADLEVDGESTGKCPGA